MTEFQWRDLSTHWDQLKEVASLRQQKIYNIPLNNNNSHLTGLAGELVFSMESGLPINLEFIPGDHKGDGGTDFPGISVRTSQYLSDPEMKFWPNEKLVADYYCLVVLAAKNKRGKYIGYCDRQTLLDNRFTKNYGYGPRQVLKKEVLIKELPPIIKEINS